ncbi:mCG112981 [Mus musculus]|nr:mCG112981 [Mus musculus]
MLWLKKLLDTMKYQVTFVPIVDSKNDGSRCKPKATVIIVELASPPQGL